MLFALDLLGNLGSDVFSLNLVWLARDGIRALCGSWQSLAGAGRSPQVLLRSFKAPCIWSYPTVAACEIRPACFNLQVVKEILRVTQVKVEDGAFNFTMKRVIQITCDEFSKFKVAVKSEVAKT